MRSAGTIAAVAAILAIGHAAPAAAHVVVVDAAPADGERVQVPPRAVALTFSAPVSTARGSLRVLDRAGRRVDRCCPTSGSARVVVPLRPNVPADGYVVQYAVLSDDSHPVTGALRFAVGAAAMPSAGGASSTGSFAADPAAMLLRWLAFAGLMLMGGILVATTTWPEVRTDPRVARIVLGGCMLTMVATAGTLRLQQSSGGDAFELPYGRLLVLRLLAIAVIALVAQQLLARTSGRGAPAQARAENILIAAALIVALTFSAAGHAVDDPIPLITLLADMAHLGAMALWLGGVLVFAVFTRAPKVSAGAPAALRRFSKLAAWLVGIVVVTGVWLASRALPAPDAMWTSDYGRMLLAKGTIVAVLLLTAARARRAVRGRLDASPGRTLIAELAIAAVLLGVTSALVSAPRPQPAPPAYAAGGAPTSWKSISGASRRTVPSATARDISGNAKSEAA